MLMGSLLASATHAPNGKPLHCCSCKETGMKVPDPRLDAMLVHQTALRSCYLQRQIQLATPLQQLHRSTGHWHTDLAPTPFARVKLTNSSLEQTTSSFHSAAAHRYKFPVHMLKLHRRALEDFCTIAFNLSIRALHCCKCSRESAKCCCVQEHHICVRFP